MDKQEFEKLTCRICLGEYAEQNWNDILQGEIDITYKDCYCKFTGLECFDEENFSTMLCRSCANCLQNMNIFISKAIENHYILLEKHSLKLLQKEVDDIKQNTEFEVILLEEVDIKPDIHDIEANNKSFTKESDNRTSFERNASTLEQSVFKQKPIKTNKSDLPNSSDPSSNVKTFSQNVSKHRKVPTRCSFCTKVLVSKYAALRHEKTHYENRERSVVCPVCGLKFYCKMSLRNHAQVHVENRKTYKCDFCEKSFFHKGGLNIHRRIHLGQMIPCTLCSKQYFRLIDLDKHMRSHTASKSNGGTSAKKKIYFRCEICGDNVRSINYKSHHAKHTNDPLCKCAICDKNFFSRESCASHLKKVHKKGNGERANFITELKENRRCTSLYMQQNTSKIFVEE